MVPFVNRDQGKPMRTGTKGAQPAEAPTSESEPHLRADARRNRGRILEAAAILMATSGLDVPVDEIARRAQVGVGTVYRNFPTKGALLEALLIARMQPLIIAAREAAGSDDPGDAFVSFVRRMSDEFGNFKALADAMAASGVDINVAKREISAELIGAVSKLLERAQHAGRVRPDVTMADVGAMMTGLGHAAPSFLDAEQRSRCVALVCDSLLVGARSVLPQRSCAPRH